MTTMSANPGSSPMSAVAEAPNRTPPRPVRVMLVEDSAVVREVLTHIIGRDARLELVAAVPTGESALESLSSVAPDVISMDIRLPGMNGFETTRRIMRERPTPIVVVAGSVHADDLKISMNALQAGALSVLEKPVGLTHAEFDRIAERLCNQLVIMSQVKVVRQRRAATDHPISASIAVVPRVGCPRALGIVASTGGPNALIAVLNALPAAFPVPIFVVQHMTASFMKGFIEWLDKNCPQSVVAGQPGMSPEAGHVYVAPAERHMCVQGRAIVLDAGPPLGMLRPSGTLLLESLAREYRSAACGVLLTGMGDDGAAGLAAIHRAGGHTITESEQTAVVYGMPAVAAAMGVSCESLPIGAVGPRILELVSAR